EVADFELLKQDAVLREMAAPSDFDRVRKIAKVMKSLIDNFDYTQSPEFLSTLEGKGDAFIQMKRRLMKEPKRAAESKKVFSQKLINLPNADAVQSLVAPERHADIALLKKEMRSIQDPD